jgi:serralysin
LFANGSTAPAAYFSLDGGNTKIADYGQTSDPSDFLNIGVQGPNDPFNEFYSNSTLQQLTAIDLKQLDAQGLNGDGTIGVTASLIQTDGSTSLLQIATSRQLAQSRPLRAMTLRGKSQAQTNLPSGRRTATVTTPQI